MLTTLFFTCAVALGLWVGGWMNSFSMRFASAGVQVAAPVLLSAIAYGAKHLPSGAAQTLRLSEIVPELIPKSRTHIMGPTL